MGRQTYKTTRQTINTDTGEVTQIDKWYRKAYDADNFIKLMVDSLHRLLVLTKGEYDVLIGSIRFVDFDSTFRADARYKEILGSITDKNATSISNILSSLVKKGVLYRVSRGTYELNPQIMWKGSEVNRMKRVAYYKEIALREK